MEYTNIIKGKERKKERNNNNMTRKGKNLAEKNKSIEIQNSVFLLANSKLLGEPKEETKNLEGNRAL